MAKFNPILSKDYFKLTEEGYPLSDGIYLDDKDIIKVENDTVNSILYKSINDINSLFDIFNSFDNIAFNEYFFNNLLFNINTLELGYWGNCINPICSLYNDNYGMHYSRLKLINNKISYYDEIKEIQYDYADWSTLTEDNELISDIINALDSEDYLGFNEGIIDTLELVNYADISDYISFLGKGERFNRDPILFSTDLSVTEVKFLEVDNQTYSSANSAYLLSRSSAFIIDSTDIIKLQIYYANDYSDDYVIFDKDNAQVIATYTKGGVTGNIIWISNSFNAIICRFHGGDADKKPDEYVTLDKEKISFSYNKEVSGVIWVPKVTAEITIDHNNNELFDAVTFDGTIVSYGNFNMKFIELILPAKIDTDFIIGDLVIESDINGIRLHSLNSRVKEFFISSCLIMKNKK